MNPPTPAAQQTTQQPQNQPHVFQLWLEVLKMGKDGLTELEKVDLGFAHSAEFSSQEEASDFALELHRMAKHLMEARSRAKLKALRS
jgi:hypothetical protein